MKNTIAAIATGSGVSGIGVIRISGKNALCIADKVFKSADGTLLSSLGGYRAKYGSVFENGKKFDNAVALVFKAPKSYTGENVVEISVHGGIFIVEKTLEAVYNAGAVPAAPGEFTKRAFLNGKIDLTQAEAVASLISAGGEEAAKASYNLLSGSLSKKISDVCNILVSLSASMAAWVDYPDEEIPELSPDELKNTLSAVKSELSSLIDNYENGVIITEGIKTTIAGKPNAGKSTLMNMLSGREKSIVTHIEGTTRDIVESSVRLGSLVLRLFDTAGLRQSDDIVEKMGIKKALDSIDTSSLILAVFDLSRRLDENDIMLIDACRGKKCVAVINKTDLDFVADEQIIKDNFENTVYISAKYEKGAENLEKTIKNVMGIKNFDATQPLIVNKRQKLCVKNAFDNVSKALDAAQSGITYDAINVMIDAAVEDLLTLTGKKASQEVVNNIFSRFCVGK